MSRTIAMLLLATAGFAVATATAVAIAKSFTVKVAKNVKVTNFKTHASTREPIVVDGHGVAVYTLSGETAHHLKCTSTLCFSFWPPATVHSKHAKLRKGPGVKGKLGILHRDGFFQLTLGGRPLYNFAPDHGKRGIATGEAVPSFGGTWHVIKTGPGRSIQTTTTTTTTTTSASSTYSYPY